MKNKIIYSMFALIFLFSLASVSAVEYVTGSGFNGVFQANREIELIQTCDNGVTICAACNITNIRDPNSVIVVSDAPMTKRTSDFNYTFRGATTLGTYYVTGFCQDAGAIRNWKYTFTVQSSEPAENNTITFLVLAVFAIILLVIAFVFHNYIFAFLSGLAILGTGVYAMINGFGDITSIYTRIISFVIIGLGMIVTLVSALEFLQETSGGDSLYSGGGEYDEGDE
jgi:hypothetical protein